MNCFDRVTASIVKVRQNPDGTPKAQDKKTGGKWACIATIAVIAAAIFIAAAAALLITGVAACVVGNPLGGLLMMVNGVLTGVTAALFTKIAVECIKSAHHHLKQPQVGMQGRGNRLGRV